MTNRRSWWLGGSLGVELANRSGGAPGCRLGRSGPEPWDWRALKVRFESARYLNCRFGACPAGRKPPHRSVRLLPDVTRILVRQPLALTRLCLYKLEGPKWCCRVVYIKAVASLNGHGYLVTEKMCRINTP